MRQRRRALGEPHRLGNDVTDTPLADGVVREARVQGGAIKGPGDGGALGLVLQVGLGLELGHEVLGLQVPDADAGGGGGAQPVAVGGEGDLVDGLVALELVEVLAAGQIPELGDAVLAGGGAQGAIGGHGDGVDGALVTLEGGQAAELRQGPDLDLVVAAAGHDERGAQGGAEADAGDPVGVGVLVHGEHAVTLDVPHLQAAVAATGDDLTVVRGEGDGEHVLGVALGSAELGDAVTGLEVPQAEGLVPAAGEGELGVVRQGDALDEVGVTLEAAVGDRLGLILVVGVNTLPGDDGVVAGAGHDLDGRVVDLGADQGCNPAAVTLEESVVGEAAVGHRGVN